MPTTLATLLIADDDPSIRESLSYVLTEIGYRVRSAEDGFSTLREIRHEVPDLLLSDLNMPNMSGFELLSVVRRRFPAIRTIAMSGSFSGDEVPSGVIADAFYEKGSSIRSLLKIIGGLARPIRTMAPKTGVSAPLWIQRNGNDETGEAYVMVPCPECLRTFYQAVGGSLSLVREACCAHCRTSVYYAITEPVDWVPPQTPSRFPRKQSQLANSGY
ncbi:MAG: response regulator [Terracidiphilus sp.]|jgi:CheY-like chemotaxis protein